MLLENEPELVGHLKRPFVVEGAYENRGLVTQISKAEISTVAHLIQLRFASKECAEHEAGIGIPDARVLAANRNEFAGRLTPGGRTKNCSGRVVNQDRLLASQRGRPELVESG